MNLGFLNTSKIDQSKFIAVVLLNLGALSWFFIINFYLADIFNILVPPRPPDPSWAVTIGNSLIYGFTIFWSVTVSFIGGKINRRQLLLASTILGIFSTILLAFAEGPLFAAIVASLIGTSLGLGLPASMALVADNTVVENRGRASGILILATFIIAFTCMAICRTLGFDTSFDLSVMVLILVGVRSISLFPLVLGKFDRSLKTVEKKIRLSATAYREFIFYLIPWFIFTIASSLAYSLISAANLAEGVYVGDTLKYVFIAVFGLVAGFMADRYGRKQPIILGLAIFGVGYLLLGFGIGELAVNIYSALSGVTWGLFFVIFLAVPGDLSTPILREKFYALGYILPVTALFALSAIQVENIGDILPPETIAQILGICLFLAMYPVFRAKETLTQGKIRERKMKEYVEKLGKAIQETEKNE